jgi:histone H3/H4
MTKTTEQKSKRKRRAATNAIREIKNEQKRTNHIIPVAPFNRLVQEIAQKHRSGLRFKSRAYDAFHVAAEDYLIKCFSDANTCAIHSRRETVQPKDLQLSLSLQEA